MWIEQNGFEQIRCASRWRLSSSSEQQAGYALFLSTNFSVVRWQTINAEQATVRANGLVIYLQMIFAQVRSMKYVTGGHAHEPLTS